MCLIVTSPGPGPAHASEDRPTGSAQATIEHLFEFSPDGILVTMGRGSSREANPRVAERSGTRDELIGQPIRCWCRSVFAAVTLTIERITQRTRAPVRWALP